MDKHSDNYPGKRPDRTFADAMREAGEHDDYETVFTGSVLAPPQKAISREKLDRIKADVRAGRDPRGELGPLKNYSENEGPKAYGCFWIIVALVAIGLAVGVGRNVVWIIGVNKEYGAAAVASAAPLLAYQGVYLLLWLAVMVSIIVWSLRYQRGYTARIEELVRDLTDEDLVNTNIDRLLELFQSLHWPIRLLLIPYPRTRTAWNAFLAANLDIYFAAQGRFKVHWLEWAGRFWVLIYFFGRGLAMIPEVLLHFAVLPIIAQSCTFPLEPADRILIMAPTAVALLCGHAIALRDIRVNTWRREIEGRINSLKVDLSVQLQG